MGQQVEFSGPAPGGATPSTTITGLTSRQLVFGSSAGGIAQIASFQIDSTLAYLGIGTSAPGTDIHIQHGGTTAAGITVEQTTNRESFLQTIVSVAGVPQGFGLFQETTRLHLRVADTAASTVGATLITFNRDGNVGFGTTAPTAPLTARVPAGGGPSLVLQSSAGADQVFVNSSGHVGIGTTAPTRLLTINGGSSVTGIYQQFQLIDAVGNARNVFGLTTGASRTVFNAVGGAMIFVASGTTATKIGLWNSSGQLGIGTTTPDARLHVAGSARFGASTADRIGFFGSSGATRPAAISTNTPAAVYTSAVGLQLNLVTEALRSYGLIA